MNRLSPLIVRKTGRFAPALAIAGPALPDRRSEWRDDVQQFLTGWIGGMVFFLTFLA